jgi:hypothetical protein
MPGILAAERAENLCHQAIFMNHDSSAITPPDAKRVRAGAYCKVLMLAQDAHRGALVPDQGPVQQLASGKDRIVSPL